MFSAAVIGASGYVGGAVANKLGKNPDCRLFSVTRDNYSEMSKGSYDVLIHSANPSKRFWAKQHPEDDYRETVQKTEDLHRNWNYKKFVLISTVSVRCEPKSVYGKNKSAAEKICQSREDLVIRLSAMFSEELSKGALVDILNGGKVFVSGESRYPYASLDFISGWIANNLDRKGLVELGARNSISLQEIADHLQQTVDFEGPLENQTLKNPSPDFPDAREVLLFMEKMKRAVKK